MIQLSVIVCCYNSEHLLNDTLSHLANQVTNNNLDYEVVLVDNNSTDQTAKNAREIWGQLYTSTSLTIVTESQPGLSYARKKGVLVSKGDYIIFCDDDNWLQEDYLQIAYDFMNENPNVGALGGQSVGVLEIEEPTWWEKEKNNYAVGKQAENSGDITNRGYVWGAGIVLRKKVMLELYNSGFISLLSDRKGTILSSGGDSELCKWLLLMGYKLWYLEVLQFKHYITGNRLTDIYLKKLLEGHKQSKPILNLYKWFYNSGIFKKVNHFTLKEKRIYFKKGIRKCLKRESDWRKELQLAFGTSVKIHPYLYQIIKTYKHLSK